MSWVFQQLRESGLKPNGATYGLAMEVITGLQHLTLSNLSLKIYLVDLLLYYFF